MPLLHLLAGPNGAGKSTYSSRLLEPMTHLPVINADEIAAAERRRLLSAKTSFITETVFSHPSKLDLIHEAAARGYLIHLHVILVPVDLAVKRVAERVHDGGHRVPEQKVRARYARLCALLARARWAADRTEFFDNSIAARPFRPVALYEHGFLLGMPRWPEWTPSELTTMSPRPE